MEKINSVETLFNKVFDEYKKLAPEGAVAIKTLLEEGASYRTRHV